MLLTLVLLLGMVAPAASFPTYVAPAGLTIREATIAGNAVSMDFSVPSGQDRAAIVTVYQSGGAPTSANGCYAQSVTIGGVAASCIVHGSNDIIPNDDRNVLVNVDIWLLPLDTPTSPAFGATTSVVVRWAPTSAASQAIVGFAVYKDVHQTYPVVNVDSGGDISDVANTSLQMQSFESTIFSATVASGATANNISPIAPMNLVRRAFLDTDNGQVTDIMGAYGDAPSPGLGTTVGIEWQVSLAIGVVNDWGSASMQLRGPPQVYFDTTSTTMWEDAPDPTIPVRLSHNWSSPITVTWENMGGSSGPADHDKGSAGTTGTIVFARHTDSAGLAVDVVEDAITENDETLDLAIKATTRGKVDAGRDDHRLTIWDDDVDIRFTATSGAKFENLGSPTITVEVVGPSGPKPLRDPVNVSFIATPGTAEGPADAYPDYAVASGWVIVPAGTSSFQLPVIGVIDDVIYEADETVTITITGADDGFGNVHPRPDEETSFEHTILNDEPVPLVSFAAATNTSQEETVRFVGVPVVLDRPSEPIVGITIERTGGTARERGDPARVDDDHMPFDDAVLSFDPYTTQNQALLEVIDDVCVDPSETVIFGLKDPVVLAIGSPSTRTHTITSTDEEPLASFVSGVTSRGEPSTIQAAPGIGVALGTVVCEETAVAVQLVGGTATLDADGIPSGEDFRITSSSYTVPVGEDAVDIDGIQIYPDELDERNETILLRLVDDDGYRLGPDIDHTHWIADNDTVMVVAQIEPLPTEGDAGSTDVTVTFRLVNATDGATPMVADRDLSVHVRNATPLAGEATPGPHGSGDYDPIDEVVTILAGQSEATWTIRVHGDTLAESDETLRIILTPLGINDEGDGPVPEPLLATDTLSLLIPDDDVIVLSVSDAQGLEDDGPLRFWINMTNAADRDLFVALASEEWEARSSPPDDDFAPVNVVRMKLPAGLTEHPFLVTPYADPYYEPDERFLVHVTHEVPVAWTSIPDKVTMAPDASPTVGTLVNDDPMPEASVADVTVTEGTGGTTDVTITATLGLRSHVDTHVPIQIIPVTGGAGFGTDPLDPAADIEPVGLIELVFEPGQTTRSATITVVGDHIFEPDEEFILDIDEGALVNATQAVDGDGTLLIEDDDQAHIRIAPNATLEDTGSLGVWFELVDDAGLPVVAAMSVTATFNITQLQAGTPEDHDLPPGDPPWSISLPPLQGSAPLLITVHPDLVYEVDESFNVTLRSVDSGVLLPLERNATMTILNDDLPPLLVADAPIVEEGNTGTVTMTWTLALVDEAGDVTASSLPASFSYVIGGGSADPDDVDFPDYEADDALSGSIMVPAGDAPPTLSITVHGDDLVEGDETVDLSFGDAEHVRLPGPAVGTIRDVDDAGLPDATEITILDHPQPGDDALEPAAAGAIQVRTIRIQATHPIQDPVSFLWGTRNASGPMDARAGLDFIGVPAASRIAQIPAKATEWSLQVDIRGDALDEHDEVFEIVATSLDAPAMFSAGGDVAVVTIEDEDPLPIMAIDDVEVDEGAGVAQVEIRLTDAGGATIPSGRDITFDLTTRDVAGCIPPGCADEGLDYQALTATRTIPAGTTTITVDIPIIDESPRLHEGPEVFEIVASGADWAVVDPSGLVATVTIIDNDVPRLQVDSPTVMENDPSGVLPFVVSIQQPDMTSVFDLGFQFNTADMSAVAPDDYILTSGTYEIPAGQSSIVVQVPIVDDAILEDLFELVGVSLGAPQEGAQLAPVTGCGCGRIQDNDQPPSFYIVPGTYEEDVPAAIHLNMTEPAAATMQVTYEVVATGTGPGHATIGTGSDVQGPAGPQTVTFDPGQTSIALPVTWSSDDLDELAEQFGIVLSDPVNLASPNDPDVTPKIPVVQTNITILDADTAALSIASAPTVAEDAGLLAFPLSLDMPRDRPVCIPYTFIPKTGSSPPYQATLGPGPATDHAAAGDCDGDPCTCASIAAGATSGFLYVSVLDDLVSEDPEAVRVRLGQATFHPQDPDPALDFGVREAQGIITDDDPLPVLHIPLARVVEGDGPGTAQLVFEPELDAAHGRQSVVEIQWSTIATPGLGLHAAGASDFTAASGVLAVAPGATVLDPIILAVTGDDVDEGDEHLALELSEIDPGTGDELPRIDLVPTWSGIIEDDDLPSILIPDDQAVGEAAGSAPVVVRLSQPSIHTITVSVDALNGTGAAMAVGYPGAWQPGMADFQPVAGPGDGLVLTFPAGTDEVTLPITILDDGYDEHDETFHVVFSDARRAGEAMDSLLPSLPERIHNITIIDDEQTEWHVQASAGPDLESGLGLVFEVWLTHPTLIDHCVDVLVAPTATPGPGAGPAEEGVDYNAWTDCIAVEALQEASMESPLQWTLPIIDDQIAEGDEMVTLTLLPGAEASCATDPCAADGRIVDDEVVLVEVLQETPTEGDFLDGAPAQTPLGVSLRLSHALESPLETTISIAGGSATLGTDFTGSTETLVFPAGVAGAEIEYGLIVLGDRMAEGDETIELELTHSDHLATFDGLVGSLSLTIIDDDVPDIVTLHDPLSVAEGGIGLQGVASLGFDAQPTADVTFDLSVDDQVQLCLKPWDDCTDDDWTDTASVLVPFDAACCPDPVLVTLRALDDPDIEGTHTGTLTLATRSLDAGYDAAIGTRTWTIEIQDNDAPGLLLEQVDDALQAHEDGTGDAQYKVRLVARPTSDVVLNLLHGGDQVDVVPTQLTFTPDDYDQPRTVRVVARDDPFHEGGIHAALIIHGLVSADADYNGLTVPAYEAQVVDDDLPVFILTHDGVQVSESGATDTYLVTLGSRPHHPVHVSLTTDSQVKASSSQWTIQPHAWDQPFEIVVRAVDDPAYEETPHIGRIVHNAISDDGDYAGVKGTLEVQIADNDPEPVVSMFLPQMWVGEAIGDPGVVVRLDRPSSQAVTVHHALTPGSATQGKDFTYSSAPVVVAPGSTTAFVPLHILDDADPEKDETFTIRLTSATGATLSPSQTVVTIEDNDIYAPLLRHTEKTTEVNETGTTDVIQIRLNAQPDGLVVLQLTIDDGTEARIVGSDTLTLGPNDWSQWHDVTVAGVDDTLSDGVRLSRLSAVVDPDATTDPRFLIAAPPWLTIVTWDDEPPAAAEDDPAPPDTPAPVPPPVKPPAGPPVDPSPPIEKPIPADGFAGLDLTGEATLVVKAGFVQIHWPVHVEAAGYQVWALEGDDWSVVTVTGSADARLAALDGARYKISAFGPEGAPVEAAQVPSWDPDLFLEIAVPTPPPPPEAAPATPAQVDPSGPGIMTWLLLGLFPLLAAILVLVLWVVRRQKRDRAPQVPPGMPGARAGAPPGAPQGRPARGPGPRPRDGRTPGRPPARPRGTRPGGRIPGQAGGRPGAPPGAPPAPARRR